MTKLVRKMQAEIDKNLKAIDEVLPYTFTTNFLKQGIVTLEGLESKLQNAPSQSQKEKFEIEMKKEIKKLQRLREWFKGNLSNQDIKDKSKLLEAKKRIESVSVQNINFIFIYLILTRIL